ncbi:MAG TPA: nuclear transport factor 2 family protein [Mucilaginibacter sp.]|jgi:ketosteroid isomerase-like protein
MKLTTLFGKILLVWALLSCGAGFAQTTTAQATQSQSGPNEKVLRAYFTAFEKKDWNSMQQILADGFTFSSPLDDHISIKAFKERCWPNAYKIKKFDVDKVVINGDEALVITNGWTTTGKLFRNSDYFKLKGGKIMADECFFGPGINYPNNSEK